MPHPRGPSHVSVEMMEMAALNTYSMAFERRKIQIGERMIKAKGAVRFCLCQLAWDLADLHVTTWKQNTRQISELHESRCGYISNTKRSLETPTARGTSSSWTSVFCPRHRERKSKTALPFSSKAVLGTLRGGTRNQTLLNAPFFFSPIIPAIRMGAGRGGEGGGISLIAAFLFLFSFLQAMCRWKVC